MIVGGEQQAGHVVVRGLLVVVGYVGAPHHAVRAARRAAVLLHLAQQRASGTYEDAITCQLI